MRFPVQPREEVLLKITSWPYYGALQGVGLLVPELTNQEKIHASNFPLNP